MRCCQTPPTSRRERGSRADASEVWGSDVVVTIAPPDPQQIRGLGSGSILIGFLAPLSRP